MRALEKTYIFGSNTVEHVETMWVGLSRIRALLPVQMSQEEEGLMRDLLWYDKAKRDFDRKKLLL